MVVSLKQYYLNTVVPQLLQEQNDFNNIMQIPKIKKIVFNMGVGQAAQDKKILTQAMADMTKIAGQKAVATKAKKSVAGFKIREGWPIGCCVTLRHDRMYEFLERLLYIALPRVRDFRGLNPKSFDGQGNYTLGLREQIVFPEIQYDKIDAIRGMNITIATTATNDKDGRALLTALKFPFKSSGAAK